MPLTPFFPRTYPAYPVPANPQNPPPPPQPPLPRMPPPRQAPPPFVGPPEPPGLIRIVGVQIINEGGIWKITGTVNGMPPGAIIRISSSNPAWNGRVITVENPDGSFEIGLVPSAGDPGGTIGIIAESPGGGRSIKINRDLQ